MKDITQDKSVLACLFIHNTHASKHS